MLGGPMPPTTKSKSHSAYSNQPTGTISGTMIRRSCLPHSMRTDVVRIAIRSLQRPPRNASLCGYFGENNDEKEKDYFSTGRREKECEGELRVTAQLFCLGMPLHSAVVSTRVSEQETSRRTSGDVSDYGVYDIREGNECHWDDVLEIPILWKDLSRDACLALNVLGPTGEHLYGSTLTLFDRQGLVRSGLQKMRLYRNSKADVCVGSSIGATPGLSSSMVELGDYFTRPNCKFYGSSHWWKSDEYSSDSIIPDSDPPGNRGYSPENEEFDSRWKATLILDRLENETVDARYASASFKKIPSVPWLDKITKERCHQILDLEDDIAMHAEKDPPISCFNPSSSIHEAALTSSSHLIVELPVFPIPVIHEEILYPSPLHGASGSVTPLDLSLYRRHVAAEESVKNNKSGEASVQLTPSENDMGLSFVHILDYEDEDNNPVEDKYRTLAHDLLRGVVDPALKPDREQRNRLNVIIASPSHHLTREEKDLLWRFRFSLVDNRKALTKFLLAVDWPVESEVVQAAELLEEWRKRSTIDVTDALKLLGKNVAFQTSLVRSYAIDRLADAPDAELSLYLLQLVQALKYEDVNGDDQLNSPHGNSHLEVFRGGKGVPSLAGFLISRAAKNLELATYLYWYLKVELETPTYGERYRLVFEALEEKLSCTYPTPIGWSTGISTSNDAEIQTVDPHGHSHKSKFLSSVSLLGSSFRSAGTDEQTAQSFDSGNSQRPKQKAFDKSMWGILLAQDKFILGIMECQRMSRDVKGKKDAKEENLREVLGSRGFHNIRDQVAVPLPTSPHLFITGINPDSARMFKSALYPAVIDFCAESEASKEKRIKELGGVSDSQNHHPEVYRVIVKTGDDLRQDQLVIMMVRLMDGILKRGTLDLCLKPYSIIATSPETGLMEFVPGSLPISMILATHNNSIQQFFQKVAPHETAKYKIQPEVMNTYIRSCAGYCVITYLLGVGDRHLDNLMLQPSGHFFHLDFGFIFGRDPKPLPPPFRLTREMVDAMGDEYKRFCSLACQAYNLLRKNAGLVLNLLHLMSDAGIQDLSNNPLADAEHIIAKVEDRFRLDLNDSLSEAFFMGLINDSLVAIAPRVMDVLHTISVSRR